jgi:hypothetical protein
MSKPEHTEFGEYSSYGQFVEMLAANNVERDGSPAEHVAEVAIIDTENLEGTTTLRFSLEPYADDPATETRVWPKDIIKAAEWSPEDINPDGKLSLRDLAVYILATDIKETMDELS